MSKIEVNAIEPQCGTTLTLGASGDTVSIASGANLSGVGTVSWDTTAKTAAFTAVSGNGYFVNTTSGAITVTLPAGSAGAIVAFADYANTFDTNNLTIAPNGSDKIGGINANAKVSTKGASTTFVYVDSTQGWKQVNDATLNTTGENFIVATGGTISTCGNCKIHTFTGPGTFCVSSISNTSQNNEVSYVVVAGGAGGGGGSTGPSGGGGGGGAGGFREDKSPVTPYTASPLEGAGSITVTATAFPITVGGGGAASPVANSKGGSGSNSVFSTVTSTGGGGGGYYLDAPSATNNPGVPGGSGGGAAGHPSNPGGTGNTPPVSPAQGNPGGTGQSSTPVFAGAGGGGATAAGGNSSPSQGGPGGAGATTSISGSSTAYAGGGGGGSGNGSEQPGGVGGGGSGGFPGADPGSAGTTNTGGGGGGAGSTNVLGGAGGSGIVIIRYKYQ